MTKITILSMLLGCMSFLNISAQDYTKFVDPFIGTEGMGHTFPGACVPFGIVQLSPDTDTIPHNLNGVYQKDVYAYCAGYQHKDPTIVGFSHTHLSGTGHSDLGDILVMPAMGKHQLNPGREDFPDEGYRSRVDHSTESAAPGYYEVTLKDHNIKACLTATPRVGIHKYIFPKEEGGHLILDLNHGIYNYDGKVLWANLRVENDTLITGYRITNGWARTNYTYFAISFSQPITNYGYKDHEPVKYNGFWRRFKMESNFPEIGGKKIVAYFDFDTKHNPELEIRVALSAVSTEGALMNLKAETEGKTFAQLASQASELWNRRLSQFEVEGTDSEKKMFYTSLYHTMINPSVYMDVDGLYRGLDNNIHKAEDFDNYSIFSLWDTYRAEHPLLNIIAPKENAGMVKSMIAHQNQSVHKMLPVWSHMGNENWCMSGYHATSVLADAVTKNVVKGTDNLLKAMVETSEVEYYDNLKDYIGLGYIPFDKSATAASSTLENCYDDWTIYKTALNMNRKDIADVYYKRALTYRNIFDKSSGFVTPRTSDGNFKSGFDPLQTHGEGFIEGNSWNFSFHVPHDVNGIMELMGGDRKFVKRLDDLFTMDLPAKYYEKNEDITKEGLIGGYVHGNEPSHHIPYLYAWTSQPWKSQFWTREIMNRMYRSRIDGLGGNDDCGQMSAWYVFSVMGFYPVCPGTDQYILSAPYLPYIKFNMPNGKTLEIVAKGVSDENRYVKQLIINGKVYDKTYITHNDLLQGGRWEFVIDSKPNKKRGLGKSNKPYSLSVK